MIVRKDRIEWASAVHLIIIEDIYYYKECKDPINCTDEERKVYRSGGSGTGFSVKVENQKKNETHILTVAHVCSTEMAPPSNYDKEKMIIERNLYISNGDHRIMIPAKVVRENIENDLCVLKIDTGLQYVFKISKKDPEYSERVFNIGAPLGFYGPTFRPFSEGFFSGYVPGVSYYTGNGIIESLYHIAAIGGMSGSPIINSKGQVVGMVQAVNTGFPFLTYSATTQHMHAILEDL